MEIEFRKVKQGYERVGYLAYNTLITEVPSHPSSVYMVIRGNGEYPSDRTQLLNLTSGTFRSIDDDTKVLVLDGKLVVHEVGEASKQYLRGYCR